MTTSRNKLLLPIAPRIPSAVAEWDQRFMDEYSRILRLYFNQLDGVNSAMLGTRGGQYLEFPYGIFSSATSQPLTVASTPYVVAFTTTGSSSGITTVSNKIFVTQSGTYAINFVMQLDNSAATVTDVWAWLRKNGTDVVGTSRVWMVPAAHGGTSGYVSAVSVFDIALVAGDYIEVVAAADAVGTSIAAYASSTSPFTRPSAAAAYAVVNYVSA